MFVQAYLPAGTIAGVRTRRIIALVFDLVFVSILSFALWLALAVLTFGLSLFILPPSQAVKSRPDLNWVRCHIW
jgi:hypothetical protein